MTVRLKFGRALCALMLCAGLATGCYDDSYVLGTLKEYDDRLDALEGTTINSINEQITSIKTSVSDLKDMDASLDGYIKTLEATSADLHKQIDEANAAVAKVEAELGMEISALEQSLLNQLNTAKDAIEAEIAAIEVALTAISSADAVLSKKIDELQAYMHSQLASATNWANATFSTLTQYAETQTEISAIKASIEQTNASLSALEARLNGKIADDIKTAIDALRSELNADYVSKIENAVTSVTSAYNSAISSAKEELTAAYKAAIATAIAESEAGMKAWVNEQLAQKYYDITTLDGILSALSNRLGETDTALQKKINEQESALEVAKTELTSACKTAINEAITENNGLIDKKISDSLQDAMNKVDAKLAQINSKIESIENELQEVKDTLGELTREFSIEFDDYDIGITPGSSASVAYTVIGATDKTTVKALGQNGWRAQVVPEGTNKGRIKVTAPDPITEDEIIVLVYDGEYRTIMSSINFVNGVIAPSQTAYEVSAEAGTVDVKIMTNYNYSVRISESAQSWLSILSTKSLRTDVVTLAYSAYNGNMRHAIIDIEDELGDPISQFAVIQRKHDAGGDLVGVDLSAAGTANCYIVSERGPYQFTPTKGASNETVGTIASAEVLWETFGTDVTPKVGDLVKNVKYENGVISFQTPLAYKEGNAVIAAKDASGTILWSWHIWLTDQPQGQEYYNDAGTMMDRNLGATSATPGDVGALGLLYQWGRKDPFPGSSSIFTETKAKSTITWPSSVGSDSSNGTIAYATANPTTFIRYNNSNYDWYYTGSSSTDNTRWTTSESSKSIYDPCPAGWRVPDGGSNGVWSKACGSSSYFEGYPYDNTNEGMNFSRKFGADQTIWYPASGCRVYNDGSLSNVGGTGNYWSASPYGNNAYRLYFYYYGNVYPSNNAHRAICQSVRCIKEGTGLGSSASNVVDLSADGKTANSYVVSEAGSYKFTPTKGNSSEPVGSIASAEVLWETFGTDVTPNVGDLVKNVKYENGVISFETSLAYKEGNAVIAAKDASDTNLWSWHIWLTDQPQGQEYYNNACTMMDRNLGATSATPGDVGALGLLYQWGRKDPFLGSSSIHYDSMTEANSTITWPSSVSSDSSNGTIAYATANPTTFIGYNTSNRDWYYTGSSSTDNTRWVTSESNKSIYDPCPSGWRVPDGGSNGVWSKALGSSSYFAYTYDSTNKGMNFSGKFSSASIIWYPASGYRNYYDGSLGDVGDDGYYWSASPDNFSAYSLYFYYRCDVFPSYNYNRAYGLSVRCLQE